METRDQPTAGLQAGKQTEHLPPLAMWAIRLLLYLPLACCYLLLAIGTDPSPWLGKLQLLMPIAGFVAAAAIAAVFWQRLPALRYLPLLYGVAFGLTIALRTHPLGWRTILEGTAAGFVSGVLIMFSIWIETLGSQR